METSQDTTRDREMILASSRWPQFYLPLKRKSASGGLPEVALLRSATQDENANFTVDVNLTLWGAIGEVERKVYNGVDAILADGWVVD